MKGKEWSKMKLHGLVVCVKDRHSAIFFKAYCLSQYDVVLVDQNFLLYISNIWTMIKFVGLLIFFYMLFKVIFKLYLILFKISSNYHVRNIKCINPNHFEFFINVWKKMHRRCVYFKHIKSCMCTAQRSQIISSFSNGTWFQQFSHKYFLHNLHSEMVTFL